MTMLFDSSNPRPNGLESPQVSFSDLEQQIENGEVVLATKDSLTEEWFWSRGYVSKETFDTDWVSFKFSDFSWSDKLRMPDRKALVRVSTMALVRPEKIDSPSYEEVDSLYIAAWSEQS